MFWFVVAIFLSKGLYRIEISHNPLGEVPEFSFDGLERSLWELLLHHNRLVEVPSRAIHNLKKLRYLDLSANQIDCIELNSFAGLDGSLEYLSLADNSIDSLPRGAFTSLPKLETIDLSGNNIAYLDPNIFEDGMPSLVKVSNSISIFLTKRSSTFFIYELFSFYYQITYSLNYPILRSVHCDHFVYSIYPIMWWNRFARTMIRQFHRNWYWTFYTWNSITSPTFQRLHLPISMWSTSHIWMAIHCERWANGPSNRLAYANSTLDTVDWVPFRRPHSMAWANHCKF